PPTSTISLRNATIQPLCAQLAQAAMRKSRCPSCAARPLTCGDEGASPGKIPPALRRKTLHLQTAASAPYLEGHAREPRRRPAGPVCADCATRAHSRSAHRSRHARSRARRDALGSDSRRPHAEPQRAEELALYDGKAGGADPNPPAAAQ